MERFCQDCNTKINGRSDKKFCSDACRNNYNNGLWSRRYHIMKDINAILKKNHNILQHFNESGQFTVSKLKFMATGFNTAFFTHQQTMEEGQTINFVYDQGYFIRCEEIHLIANIDLSCTFIV